ncbi:TPA: hypothetical protein ACK3Q6_000765, partial [Burkholderia cepacia]
MMMRAVANVIENLLSRPDRLRRILGLSAPEMIASAIGVFRFGEESPAGARRARWNKEKLRTESHRPNPATLSPIPAHR